MLLIVLLTGIVACNKLLPGAPADDEILDGPVAGLTPEQNAIFLRGDIAFNDEVFTTATGLGQYSLPPPAAVAMPVMVKVIHLPCLQDLDKQMHTGNQFLHLGWPAITTPGYSRFSTRTNSGRSYFFKIYAAC